MNPGNGIETHTKHPIDTHEGSFKLMNPGNGIETYSLEKSTAPLQCFQINESWQRDWNKSLDVS